MKVKIWNVDKKPYRMEFSLPETSASYPHLRITHRYTGGTINLITFRPGPIVDLFLTEENLTLKRCIGKKEEILTSNEGEGGPKRGLFSKLFSRPKVGDGVKIRVANEKAGVVLETMLQERKDSRLSLEYYATNIMSIRVETGPLLDIFLMNGSLWLVDDENTQKCIMSTERKFDVDTSRFTYYDTPF